MKYFEVDFVITPTSDTVTDLLSAFLADEGFEAFETTDSGLKAWVQQPLLSPEAIDRAIGLLPLEGVNISYTQTEAPYENWNQVWEQEGFHPIVITGNLVDEACSGEALIVIHDTNHTDYPTPLYDISINPCQAFGTGSHQTTRMILRQLLDMSLKGRTVVDAGTGTGILSIMCMMLGATQVYAYDIDEWSVSNAKDNLLLNGISNGVELLLGDSSVLSAIPTFQITDHASSPPTLLIANINRNILLADMPRFATCLPQGGELLLSGFYTDDVPVLISESAKYGFSPTLQKEDTGWAMLLLKKG